MHQETPKEIVQIECNLDDMTGEELGFFLQQVLEAGALDAWYVPIYAKKNRPAVILSVLCRPEQAAALQQMILRNTSTLGVRWQILQREIAKREVLVVETPWGPVRCKVKRLGQEILSVKAEYEDCAQLARETGLPLRRITEEAQQKANQQLLG